MKILLLHRQDSAVAYYRTWIRGRMLRKLGHEVTFWQEGTYKTNLRPRQARRVPKHLWPDAWLKEHLNEFDLLWADRAIANEEVGWYSGFRHYSRGCRLIVDFDDDFTSIPNWNHSRGAYVPGAEPYIASMNHLALSEMATVSTEPLAVRFASRTHAIRVLPNLIDLNDWAHFEASPERAADPCLRVLYGGAAGHYGDMDEAKDALKGLIENPPVPWRLICFGTLPRWVHDASQAYPDRVIRLPWVPFKDYPQAIAWGGFDVAIAPLKDHPFNHSKSNIKWLEAAAQGIPFLCSDVGPYATIPDGCAIRVRNTPAAWAAGLRDLLTKGDLRASLVAAAATEVASRWTLDSGLKTLQSVVEEAADLPRIETAEAALLPTDRPAESPG